jgi:hypothetical protein
MKIDSNDVKRMSFTLLFVTICAVVGISLTSVIWKHIDSLTKEYNLSLNTQKELRSKLSRASSEQDELRGFIAQYQKLEARGVIGDEHRLGWIEKLRNITQQRKLLDMTYELQPQQPTDPVVTNGPTGDVEFMTSIMKMRLMMLHEEDLTNFISDLSASVDAIIRVHQCNVERIANPTSQAQLMANCTIEWITVRQKSTR